MPTPPPIAQSVTAHLIARDAAAALDFYRRAFGAHELYRLTEPSGKVGHAEFEIGNTRLMIADEYPNFGALSATAIGGSPVKLLLYVPDADAAFRQALAAGATELRPVQDQFYGDRSGMVIDPFGFTWSIATHIKDVSPEDMQAQFNKAFA